MKSERTQLNWRTWVSPETNEHEDAPEEVPAPAEEVALEADECELVAAEVKVAPVRRSHPRVVVKRMVM